MTIRPSVEADEVLLVSFRKEEWPRADREHFGDREIQLEKKSFKLVALLGEKIMGYVACTLDMGVLYIDSLIVGHEYQRQGVGSALMRAAEAQGKAMGAHKAWLETGIAWNARMLYDQMGYTVVVILRNHYGNEDYVLYEKEI
jgi:ribosomal protein S18 acetylase RimI-like enzyme